MEFKLGELFCGPGGMALGAFRARLSRGEKSPLITHAWANDYDQDSCDTYSRNLCGGVRDTVICEDVRKLDIKKLSPIDGFAYGFPCNDFSIVGKQKGFDGSFGPLYLHGIEVLDFFRPKFFVAENVGGLQSANDGKALTKILSDLRMAGPGYNLTTHLYKFEDYGVPQTRHRVVIVGIDKSMGHEYRVPKPTTLGKHVSVRKALENPPIPSNAKNQEITSQSTNVIERLKHTRPGENAWTANLPRHLRLNVKGAKLSQIYKRFEPNHPAYTLTGSGGGGTHGYHWKENRALTNRERARIQTFPDGYVFSGSKESVRKQIGMAVSPKMAQIIFEAVLKTIAGIPYEFVAPSFRGQLDLFKGVPACC